MIDLTFDEAIEITNKLISINFHRDLKGVEIIVLKAAWNREEYDMMAAQHQYATSYISQDVAPRLWKYLTECFGKKVRKSNFKQVLTKYWSQQYNCRENPDFSFGIAIKEGRRKREEERSMEEDRDDDPNFLEQPIDIGVFKPKTILTSTSNVKHSFFETKNQDNTVLTTSDVNWDSEKHNNKNQYLSVEDKKKANLANKLDIYVERPIIESICYQTIKQPGSFISIKSPSFIGKTYLVTRVLNQLARQNYRTVSLSFELADIHTHFTDINKFLRWFCINVSRELGLASELDKYWNEEGIGAKVSCTKYFEEYLLPIAENPLILCLDDVDLLFPYPQIYEDFFSLLRSWYEKAKSHRLWKNLRLIIVHSTAAYTRLNINQPLFNVGLPIELGEFNCKQVINFARQHEFLLSLDMLEKLMELVGGHPYLLELAFVHLKSYADITLEQILTEATTEAGIYSHHLRNHWLNLQQYPELAEALKQVIVSKNPVQLKLVQAYQLYNMGLVKLSGNRVIPRCNLYREFFGMSL